MAYTRPSLETLIQRVKGDISSRTEGSSFIRRSFEIVLGLVVAGVSHGIHGHLEWVLEQLFPDKAERAALIGWGNAMLVTVNGASFATGAATFTGSSGTINIGVTATDDAGNVYTCSVPGTISGGSVSTTWIADVAGADGSLTTSAPLTLVSAIANIDSEGTVDSPGFISGADVEGTEAYRVRVLADIRVPPSGGGPGDYVSWAKKTAGVTRAWEFGARMGIGTVSVGFVRDDDADMIPSAGEVATVQAYIDARKPLDMGSCFVVAPIAAPVNITVSITPNTATVQAAITAQLALFFSTEVDLEEAKAESNVSQAISGASGETAHSITSISSLVPGTWEILTLGTVTYNTL